MFYYGNLVGFVILHDRDEDGELDSLAHIWTAASARGRGVGQRLVAEVRSRFPGVQHIEGPITDDGYELFRRAWPEKVAS